MMGERQSTTLHVLVLVAALFTISGCATPRHVALPPLESVPAAPSQPPEDHLDDLDGRIRLAISGTDKEGVTPDGKERGRRKANRVVGLLTELRLPQATVVGKLSAISVAPARGKVRITSSEEGVIAGSAQEAIVNGRRAVGICYRKGLGASPGLAGTVEFRLTLDVEGKVTNVRPKRSTFAHPYVLDCVAGVLETLVFRRNSSGPGTVVYKVDFSL